jgi:DNA modification methylase
MPQQNGFSRNLLICADNRSAIDDLITKGIKADLIYIDPPFFSNKTYEIVWGDEAEVRSFKDRWAGGINNYIEWMRERVAKLYNILDEKGSFYLHCDWHASHYLKVMLDDIFGHRFFKNEIVWRIGWVSGYKTQKLGWIRNHDIIFYYTKSNDYTFNKEYIPYPPDYVRRDGKKPIGKGFPIDDTWNCNPADILDSIMIKSFSKEELGYPTQKPEALLERIVKASSNPGDVKSCPPIMD